MGKFKGKYRVDSTRLKGYDYASDGDYFVTICTRHMRHLFGRITNGEMHLSEIGELAEKFWLEIPKHFPNAILGEFIIMPNHIHAIITLKNSVQTSHCDVSKDKPLILNNNNTGTTAQTHSNTVDIISTGTAITHSNTVDIINTVTAITHSNTVDIINTGTAITHSNTVGIINNETARCDVSTDIHGQMAAIRPKPGSLSVIIRSYKSVVSKHARKTDSKFEWLERFHDRIIRDNREFQNVQNYIRNNPKNWRKDQDIFL